MANESTPDAAGPDDAAGQDAAPARRSRLGKAARWGVGIVVGLVAVVLLALAALNSPIGKRFIVDRIAEVAPASGLRIAVGRIEGDIYGQATLHDVVLSDPQGRFLTVPVAELDWRPLKWLWSGLDVRHLVARRGVLLRTPELLPGDPDAPILPDFDIRVDRLELDNFRVARGVVDDSEHRVDLAARADIRDGRVFLDADGQLGQRDTVRLLVDAEPDGDRFDLELDYRAPQGGVIAGLVGADAGYRARITGDGTWSRWRGALLVEREGERFAAFRITNRSGRYGIVGQATPAPVLEGVAADLLSGPVSLAAFGTLENSVLDGELAVRARGIVGDAQGAVDLADNAFDDFAFDLRLAEAAPVADMRVEGARIVATLDGAFRDLTIGHRIVVDRFASGTTEARGLVQDGTATYDGVRWTVPLDLRAQRVVVGNELIDPRLVRGRLSGEIVYAGTRLVSDDLRLVFPDASARFSLRGDTRTGAYALAGPVALRGLRIENVGAASGTAKILFKVADGVPWSLRANFAGRIGDVTNATLANLAGPTIAFRGGVGLGGAGPIVFRDLTVDSQKLQLALDGQVRDGTTTVAGQGTHSEYGPFTVEAGLDGEGPRAALVFADPLPAAGLKDVRVAIVPSENGFLIETEGGSMLGPFDGTLELLMPEGGPTRIAIDRLDVWETRVQGDLLLGDDGVSGDLALAGGGLDGTIALAPRAGGQAFDVAIDARSARFGGETPIAIGRAHVEASGLLADGNTTIEGDATAQGLQYGTLFLGRLTADARVRNGEGDVDVAFTGRRGSRLGMQLDAEFASQRIAVAARGFFAGRRISMPRRAIFLAQEGGGWALQPTQVGYGGGIAIASGRFGGTGPTSLELKMAKMPLSLADAAVEDLGLGGTISGVVDFGTGENGLPTGSARVQVDGLTRSGMVLTSRPIDLSLVARLGADQLETRAVIDEGGERRGRLQGRISGLPAGGALFDRLRAGNLAAQLRYAGPADALWRLAAIDTFDLTGPLSVAANVTGTLADPQVRGSLASDNLRLRSGLSGTDVTGVSARGDFAGARLRLTRFAGNTAGGGTVSGSGTVTLQDLGQRGPQMDIRIAARNASLLDANGLKATVTGPLRIVSDGIGGTIAGRLLVNRASWSLGAMEEAQDLPQISTREINAPADIAPRAVPSAPWRYLIDARAPSRVDVDGMGLESEWRANVRVRGTTDDPRIGGEASVVRGEYTFAGARFELTRGQIDFDETGPIDPRLDIRAETERDGLDVIVQVQGNAMQPEISFTSSPALPEEEILARLLFGGSITDLSATDALQLGAAVASLRGGGGLDPINQLRSAIGLDRLRIVGPDPALDRGTAVAVGKNFGRRFYAEIITDGQGYSATEVEFRVTSWLSLLASVSTIGRESVRAEVSRDY
ncbi:translocation/assembly module TamB domain-containing protein [Pelagerythrobacter marensis]|uniref:Translocation/assembly module TamB domain-containing protein n=1 Tax=Pelagerythrobacter marensis TaxID=543877 RepID=A0ABZ2CYZ2_9SPHN